MGGSKISPNSKITGGGKNLKIPTYLVLKGQNFFDPLKTRFLDVSREVSGNNFLKVQKLTFIAFLSNNFSKIFPKFFQNCASGAEIWGFVPKFCPKSRIIGGGVRQSKYNAIDKLYFSTLELDYLACFLVWH